MFLSGDGGVGETPSSGHLGRMNRGGGHISLNRTSGTRAVERFFAKRLIHFRNLKWSER